MPTEWLAHFLLNHGARAFSGVMRIDDSNAVFYIDVSNLLVTELEHISHETGGVCVCANGEQRKMLTIASTWLRIRNSRHELCSTFPSQIDTQPRRGSSRSDIPKGTVQITIGSGLFDIYNLSETGCAFSCPNPEAKNWPPGHELDCVLAYQDKLKLNSKITIVRISHELSMPLNMRSLVSCQFSDPSTAAIAHAVFEQGNPPTP